MAYLRAFLLVALISILSWFNFFQPYRSGELWQIARDWTDPRPARHILILGNSRTGFNEMPVMLRHIADSAGAPQKYEMLSLAINGSSLETLSGDARVRRALAMRWDDAILQGESRAQSTQENTESFLNYGTSLLRAVHPANGPPKLIVNWAYDRSLYPASGGYSSDEARAYFYNLMQRGHAKLAEKTGAHLVNVGKLWEYLHMRIPGTPLTSDGNHPTPTASYFVALCLYADLSGQDVANVTWAPDSVPPDVAARVRDVVRMYRSAMTTPDL